MADLFDQFGVDPSTGQATPQQQEAPSNPEPAAPAQPPVDLFDQFNVNPNTGRTNPPKPLGNVRSDKGAFWVAVDNFNNNIGKLPAGILQAALPADSTAGKANQSFIDQNQADAMDRSYQHPDAAARGALAGDFGQGVVSAAVTPWMKAKEGAGALAKAGTFMANTGGQGLALGGAQAITSDSGQSRLMNAATGGAAGIVLGGALHGAGAALKGVGNLISKPSAGIPVEHAARAKDFADVGAKPTLGMVSQNADVQGREEAIMKGTQGEPSQMIRSAVKDVHTAVNEAVDKIKGMVGNAAAKLEDAGSQVQDTLQTVNSARLSKVSDMYETAKATAGADVDIAKDNIVGIYNNVLQDFKDIKFSPRVEKVLNGLKDPQSILTVKDAVDLTKSINKVISSTDDKGTKMAGKSIINAVYDSLDAISTDANNLASKAFAAARDARRAVGDVFSQNDIVEHVISKKAQFTNEMSPDQVAPTTFRNITNMNKIKGALLSPGVDGTIDAAGKEAWDTLRATKFNQVIDSAVVNGQISFSKLAKNYNKIGDKMMDEIIGSPEAHQQLKTVMRVLDYTSRKEPGVINNSNSANIVSKMVGNIMKGNIAKGVGVAVGSAFGGPAGALLGYMLPEVGVWLEKMGNKNFIIKGLEAAQAVKAVAPRKGLGDMLPSSSPVINQVITNTGAVKASQS